MYGEVALKGSRPARRLAHCVRVGAAMAILSSIWGPAAVQAQGAGAVAQPVPAAGQAHPAPTTFFIEAFDVAGVKQLDSDTVEAAVYDFAGPNRTSADVEAARKALEDAYKARGFEAVQVEIPPQPEALFAKGIVQIRVSEAPVGTVKVSGSRYHSFKVVRAQVPSVAPGQPLNTKALEKDLASANRFPDRTVTPSFTAGKVPGTVDVDLQVQDTLPVHGSVELSNDHNPSTEPLRVTGSLSYSDLWYQGHTIAASYVVAPQDPSQSQAVAGSYTAPIHGTPWTLSLSGYWSNSNVAALGGTNVLGNGYQVGLRAIYRLPNEKVLQNFNFGFDYKNFKQNAMIADQLAQQQPIEYLPLAAGYGLSLGSDKTNLDVNLGITAGFRVFKRVRCYDPDPTVCANGYAFDQFKNKGTDSDENFVHANLDLTLRQAFKHDFVGTLKLYGQVADSHLIPNEQFAIGGMSTVRGYLLSEAVGDLGYVVSVQLDGPSLAPKLPGFVDELRLFTFLDHGQVRIMNPLPDEIRSTSLLSVGGGARLKLFKHFTGELAVGVPLRTGPNTSSDSVRTTFSAKGEF
jgi:hemolysin activation/secretion protein